MDMDDKKQFDHFMRLLMKSGLEEERIRFWVEKITSGDFDEKNEKEFMTELEEHLGRIDEAIASTEAQIEEKEKDLAKNDKKILPYLEDLAQQQPEIQKKQEQDYKNALAEGEKKALSKIEDIRGKEGSEEIESIRKRLGNS